MRCSKCVFRSRLKIRTLSEDEYILPLLIFEYFIHKTLKCGRGISEAKWHHLEFIYPLMSVKGCFVYALFSDPYLMITSSKDNLRIVLGSFELI